MCYLYLDFYFMLLFRMDCCFSENEKSEKKVSSGGGDAEESNTEPVLQVNAELGKGQLLTKNTGTQVFSLTYFYKRVFTVLIRDCKVSFCIYSTQKQITVQKRSKR